MLFDVVLSYFFLLFFPSLSHSVARSSCRGFAHSDKYKIAPGAIESPSSVLSDYYFDLSAGRVPSSWICRLDLDEGSL